jgi:two-component system, LytTR family, response regulator
MTKLRALIVDDEPLARERLRRLLGREPSVEIAGECASGTEAIATIRGTPLDVVFLDLQMPGHNGLQVLAEVPRESRPAIVFVTAHERFAVDAFAVQALDYLLKPVDRERLQTTLQRVRDHLRIRRAGELGDKLETLLAEAAIAPARKSERLTVKVDGRVVFLKPDEIVWIEAADNYAVIHLAGSQLMLRETMTALEARLGTESFTRVNRSAIVHLDQIKELQPTFHGDYTVLLRDGTKLPLSRSLRGQLEKLIAGAR